MFEHGLVEVAPGGFAEVEARAAARGLRTVVLSTRGRSFFEAVRAATGVEANSHWDALADLLWDHLHESRAIVLWPDSRAFRLTSPGDHRTAMSVLDDLPAAVFVERDDLALHETVTVLDTDVSGVVTAVGEGRYSVVVDGVVRELRRDQVEPAHGPRTASEWFAQVVCTVLVSALDGLLDLSRLDPAAAVEAETWLRAAGLAESALTPFGRALARLVQVTGHVADLTSGHGRWSLYQASLGSPDLVRAAVVHEPDTVLVKSVVLEVLPLADDHTIWLDLVPGAEDALRRSREIGVLRRAALLGGDEIEADLGTWSDWLQLRLAEVPSPVLLRALRDEGRTKRIRRLAFATLRTC